MWKKLFAYLCLTAFSAGIACGAPRIDVAADPTEVRAGEATLVSITVDTTDLRGRPELPEVPGGRWFADRTGVSQSHRYVNGRGTHTITYTIPLRLSSPGEVEIPPVTVVLKNGTRLRSAPLGIRVLAPGERGAETAAPGLEGRIAVARGGRTEFYVGEEIPLELTLTIPRGLPIRGLSFPQMQSDGRMILPDLPKDRSRHPHFTQVREGVRGSSRVVIFDTVARFLAPGDFSISAIELIGVAERRHDRNDDFFGDSMFRDFFDRAETREVTVDYPPLKVKIAPLPPPPAGVHDLKLIGDWEVETTLSPHSVRTGEPLELKLALRGTGGAEAPNPPQLEIPGFRVYPPEVKRDPAQGTSIVYALIPLRVGEFDLAPAFATFDPAKREYRVWRKEFKIAVAGNAAAATPPPPKPVPAPPAGNAVPEPSGPPGKPVRDDLFYQKPSRGGFVRLPLWCNYMPWALVFFAAAGLAAAIWELASRRRERCAADPELARRRERRDEYRRILRELKSGADVSATLRNGGLEMLAEALELPAGSGIPEIAEKVADPEVREFLLAFEASAFAPGGDAGVKLSNSLRRRLIAVMKKALAILILLGCAASLDAAEAYNAEFDRGDFSAAVKKYLCAARSDSGGTYPDAWYNAGNAEYNLGNLPLARLYLERAHLLAPRDAEIAENLNLVNRALMLPEVDRADTPAALVTFCRDRLRPDEYLALALILAGIALVVLASRRSWRRGAFITAGALGFAALLALAAMWSQLSGGYSRSRMIVVAKELELRTLPVENGGRVEARIPGGGDAALIETRGDWVRIGVNGADGWAKRDAVAPVLRGRVF